MEGKRYRVGYALEPKKVKTFILPSLLDQASRKGIDLVPVDPTKPLSEQGPFDCILHKLYGDTWARQLASFAGPTLDPPARVALLHSRATMLDAVSRLHPRLPFPVSVPAQRLLAGDSDSVVEFQFPAITKSISADEGSGSHEISIPDQRILTGDPNSVAGDSDSIAGIRSQAITKPISANEGAGSHEIIVPDQRLLAGSHEIQRILAGDSNSLAGFRFPAIAKPISANGGAGSHEMALILSPSGLRTHLLANPTLILQEFVNHGGVLFKVYVMGRHVRCVRRPSLPDVEDVFARDSDSAVVPISRISSAATEVSAGDERRLPEGMAEQLGRGLAEELGLTLFNFDVIKSRDEDMFYVVDINYFPGFAKIPDYEHVFTDFLLEVVQGK